MTPVDQLLELSHSGELLSIFIKFNTIYNYHKYLYVLPHFSFSNKDNIDSNSAFDILAV